MATQQLLVFNGGLQTKVSPHLAEPNKAVECLNVDLDKGSIYPFQQWGLDELTTATGSYVKYFNSQLISNSDPLDKRSYAEFGNRLYWSNGSYSAYGLMRWNGTTGVNAVPPTVTSYGSLTLTPTVSAGVLNETYGYVYTVVDTDGIESIPSPVSYVAPANQNVTVIIGTDTVTETVAFRRVYRTGGSNPTFNLIAELPSGTMTFLDSTKDLDVSRIELSTFNNFAPPSELTNIIENNGTCFGSVGDRVYFSQNGQPEFWNPLDFLTLNGTCTGIGKFMDLTIAFTQTSTYVIRGFSRDNITLDRLPYQEGCLNHWTIANVTEFLLWTSKNGVCMFNGSQVQVVTHDIISWSEDTRVGGLTFDGASGTFDSNVGYIVTQAVGLMGKYYAVYQSGIGVVDVEKGVASTIELEGVTALYYDDDNNRLAAVTDTLDVYKFDFDPSDNMLAIWKTPAIQDEGHGAMKQFRRIILDAIPEYVKVFVDGKQVMMIEKQRDFFIKYESIGRTIQFEIGTKVEICSLKYTYGVL